jgi:beta-lactamase class A
MVANKTGTGNGSINDIAIAWPAGKPPILIASCITQTPEGFKQGDTIHADVAQTVTGAFGG